MHACVVRYIYITYVFISLHILRERARKPTHILRRHTNRRRVCIYKNYGLRFKHNANTVETCKISLLKRDRVRASN